MIKLEIGDVMLLPKEKAMGPYKWIEEHIGKEAADFLARILHHNYIHSELYIGGGYNLAAWFNGVVIVTYPLSVISNFHIYRHPMMDNTRREGIKNLVLKYFNKNYDFVSLILNGIPEVLSLGIEPLERYFENLLPYNNPDKMICSELIARIFKDVGIIIEPKSEFVTPDDLQEHLTRLI